MLPRISSNVSVHPTEPDADPMSDWLDSIERIRAEVPDDVLVLPSHGEPFRGLHQRLDRLASAARPRRSNACAARWPNRSGWWTCSARFFARSIEGRGDLLHMATGEALANLNHLLQRGEAVREEGADGVYRYRLVG